MKQVFKIGAVLVYCVALINLYVTVPGSTEIEQTIAATESLNNFFQVMFYNGFLS